MTVIRLYKKAEVRFQERNLGAYKEMLREQYMYANESMMYLERALADGSGSYTSSDGGDTDKQSKKGMLLKLLLTCMMRGAILYCFFSLSKLLVGNGLSEMSKFDIKMAKSINQRLEDVKGIDEIKDEVLDIISIIKNPQLYEDKGAKLFKGVMLTGEPGTGKTLLARAIAGEAGCNFIFCAGSDFDEMFVGVRARRVK